MPTGETKRQSYSGFSLALCEPAPGGAIHVSLDNARLPYEDAPLDHVRGSCAKGKAPSLVLEAFPFA